MERLRNCGYYGLEVMRLSPLAEIRNCFISGPSGGKNIVLKERGKKRNSLYVEWIWFLFAAGAVSLLFFYVGQIRDGGVDLQMLYGSERDALL